VASMSGEQKWHGTHGGYTNHGCRCDLCTAANTEKQRAYRWRSGRNRPMAEYRASRTRTMNHGTRTAYKYGCRCDECREAMRVAQANYRARKAEAR
jgi:hypothetical protein